jgi:hypothetical protein
MPQIQLHRVLTSVLVFSVLLAAPASSGLLACPGFRWAERPAGALQQDEKAAKQDTGKDSKKGKEQPGTEGGTAGNAAAKNDQKPASNRSGSTPPTGGVHTGAANHANTAAAGRSSTTSGAATNSKGAAAGGKAGASGNAGAAGHSPAKPRSGASPAKKAQANQTAATGETAGTKGGTDGKASKPKAEASEKD